MSELLYEGKAKKVFKMEDPTEVLIQFKDDATAFNGTKRGQITDKGVMNSRITTKLFDLLEQNGVSTHFRRTINEREMVVDYMRMIPLEVVVRNRIAGSLAKRTGLAEGTELDEPIVEFYYKSDKLGDPLLNEDHIRVLNLASADRVARLKQEGRRINDILLSYFDARDLILVDFKLEFGVVDGQVKLGDEISPDTSRLWDKNSFEKLDKDRFRRDLGSVEEAYQEVLKRVLS